MAQQRIALRQLVEVGLPDRAAPVQLQVVEVESRPDQRRAGTVAPVRDAYAIEAGAEADLLAHAVLLPSEGYTARLSDHGSKLARRLGV